MLVCPKCGYYNSDGSTRCEQCQARLSSTDREPVHATTAVSTPADPLDRAAAKLRAEGLISPGLNAAELRRCSNCGAYSDAAFCPHCGQSMFEPAYAGFWTRVGASLIDGFIISIASSFAGVFMPPSWDTSLTAIFATIIVFEAYEILFEVNAGGTPGKKVFKIEVVNASDLGRISLPTAIKRSLAQYLTIFTLGIGLLMAAFTRRRQTLHDMIAGTVVVKAR